VLTARKEKRHTLVEAERAGIACACGRGTIVLQTCNACGRVYS